MVTMAGHWNQNNTDLPIIVNMVLYHGSKPWNYPTALAHDYTDPKLGALQLAMGPFTLLRLPVSLEDEIYRYKDAVVQWCSALLVVHISVSSLSNLEIAQLAFPRREDLVASIYCHILPYIARKMNA